MQVYNWKKKRKKVVLLQKIKFLKFQTVVKLTKLLGLSSIAMRLRGNALDVGQYDMICNSEAKHTEICMHHLLKEFGDGIKLTVKNHKSSLMK